MTFNSDASLRCVHLDRLYRFSNHRIAETSFKTAISGFSRVEVPQKPRPTFYTKQELESHILRSSEI